MKIIRLCLTETSSTACVGKRSFDMFPVKNGFKQGDNLSPLLFNCSVECAIMRVQLNHEGLKLNGADQFLVHADDAHILNGRVMV
jgi:hypothetical protein